MIDRVIETLPHADLALILLSGLLLVALLSILNVVFVRRTSALLIQAERDKLDAFFEASPTGMVVVDQNRTIIRLNAAAVGIATGSESGLVGKKQGDALRCANSTKHAQGCGFGDECWLCPMRKLIDSVIADGKPLRNVEMPMFLLRKDGLQTIWLRVGAEPFLITGRRHVILTFEDISEAKRNLDGIKQASAELERMNREIQLANQTKGQFLANMSHEIRTPLNGVIGMTGLLMNTALSDEQRDYADTIRASGEALLNVVNDILDFSKIEADKLVLENESFDLQHCLEKALRVVAAAAAQKKLELVCHVDKTVQPVWIGDAGRLRQILVNLLGNAIKFTERGEVVVSVSGKRLDEQRFQLDFAVRDTGVGIPAAAQEKLFQSFSQVDASTTRRFGGTGLGLAISKRLCELMGGTMTLESKGIPGQGSTFRFSIIVHGDAKTKRPSVHISNDLLAGKRVLIADDNASSRETLAELAARWKMVVVTAVSGSSALGLMRGSDPFDLAVLDSEMPDMGGWELAEAIRALPHRSGVKLILLMQLGEHARGDARAPADAALVKPVPVAHLHDAFVSALTRSPVVAQPKAAPAPAPAPVVEYSQQGVHAYPLRILLAEDNVVNQKVAVRVLDKLGYRVDVVSDGSQVVEALQTESYDVVLMDVQMPELDGEQTTIHIRKELPAARQPWIVAMTANALKGDRERYLAAGMNDYLSKPIRPERLAEVLRAAQPLSSRATGG